MTPPMNTRQTAAALFVVAALLPLELTAQRDDPDALAAAEKMAASRAGADEVAAVLQREHRQTGEQSVAILRQVGYDAAPVSAAARSVYRAAAPATAEWMHRAGYDDSATLAALTRQRATPAEVLKGLRSAGATSLAVGTALAKVRMEPAVALRALGEGGYGAGEAIDGLARAGFGVRELAPAAQKLYADRAVWLGPITRAMVDDGLLDPSDPAQMAEEARTMELPAAEAAVWLEDNGVGELEAIAALAQAGYAAAEVGEVAATRIETPEEAEALALRMRQVGVVASVAVAVLTVVVTAVTFGAIVPTVTALTVAAGFGVGAVIGAVHSQGGTPEEIVEGLWQGGVAGADIAQHLQAYGLATLATTIQSLWEASGSLEAATSAVHAAGYAADEIAQALTGLGASASDLRAGLEQVISDAGLPVGDAAALLVGAGADPETTGAVLGSSFSGQHGQIALALKNADLSVGEMAEALRDGVGLSLADVAGLLRDLGLSFEQIAEAFDTTLGADAQATAQALFEQKASASQLLTILTSILHLQHDAAMEIISNIGG